MTPGQCVAILKARWKGVLLVFLLAVSSTVLVSVLLPKQYSATASVVVDYKPDPVTAMMSAGLVSPGFMSTQVEVIQSDRVAKRVVRNLKLADNPEVREQWLAATNGVGSFETWLANTLQKQLEVRPSRDSNVITVTFKGADPRFAAGLANAFVQAYLETSLALRVDPAKQYAAFFDSRAKEAREALERSQGKLSAFQKSNRIIATDERFDVESARLNELSSQAVMLQALASESGSRQVQARGNSADKLQEVLNSPLVGGLKADTARAEARLQELSARLGDKHPQVLEAEATIAALRSRIEAETQRVVGGVGVSNSIARQRDSDVRVALEAQRAQVLRMKAVRDEAAVLMREVESAQRAFEMVVGRFNQTTLESQATQSNVNMLTEAEAPLEPSSPKLLLNTAVAILLGGLLAAGGALLIELINRRVRTADDISVALGLPMIGLLAGQRQRKGLGLKPASLAQQRMVGLSRGGPIGKLARARSGQPPVLAGMAESAAVPVQQNEPATETSAVLDRSIGDIIAETCKLSPDQIGQILNRQRESGMRFGEAAIDLRLATTEDVLFALAQQYHYPYAPQAERKLSPELVAYNDPFSAQAESFRAIRSQVMKRVFNDRNGPRRALAVVSPNSGDGKTFFAANLAVTLAQLGGRTLLVDADMRGPRQHEVFNLDNRVGLAGILSGRTEGQPVQAVPGVPGLFLLPVGNSPPNPLELVERPAFALLINELASKFDHVVVDTPAAQYGADATVVAEACGATLMMTRRDASRFAQVDELAIELADGHARLAGVVFNNHRP